MDTCPACGSSNIGIGYYLGNGRLFVDRYAYHSASSSSEIEVTLCKDCGLILSQRVLRPELFSQADAAREEQLLEILNLKGLLLVNENEELPSLCGEGFSMENMAGLINRRQAVYAKVYDRRPVFLSVKAYQLLKRCMPQQPPSDTAKRIYEEISRFDCADKTEIRSRLQMNKREFDHGFDWLLYRLKITAVSARKIKHNWYEYAYAADSVWGKDVEELHLAGDARQSLWELLRHTMTEEQFEILLR